MKTIAIAAVLVAILASAGLFASGPYRAAARIGSAIQSSDPEALSECIDFPTLRTNLREQVNAYVLTEMRPQMQDNAFAVLGTALATKMTETFVDAFVTPAGLQSVMVGKPVRAGVQGCPDISGRPTAKQSFDNARKEWNGLSKFSIWLDDQDVKPVRVVLTRSGLDWRLTNIVVPQGGLGAATAPSKSAPQVSIGACEACHGKGGAKPILPEYPTLNDKCAAELLAKMLEYRAGSRTNPVMAAQVQNLTDDQLRELAEYYGR